MESIEREKDHTRSDESPSYWFVGASWNGEDQTRRFLEEGIWENGNEDKYLDEVRSIQPGDRIALKSAYVRNHGLPFDNRGGAVSVMAVNKPPAASRWHENYAL